MLHDPLVSVVMPAHNAELYIAEAIESVLNQTFRDFEFIVINDGSTDETSNIVNPYAESDPRVRVLEREKIGFAKALNEGWQEAKGKYIARLDADDISLPTRLQKQVAFLESRSDVHICGTWMKTFGKDAEVVFRYSDDSNYLDCKLLFECVLCHPTVMMRKTLSTEHGLSYDENFKDASDYCLWALVAKRFRLANLPEVLLHYRIHEAQVTQTKQKQQNEFGRQIRLMQIKEICLNPTDEELNIHQSLGLCQMRGDKAFVRQAEQWLCKLKAANGEAQRYAEPFFSRVLAEYWFRVCTWNTRFGLWTYNTYNSSELSRCGSVPAQAKAKLLAKCVLRPA